MNHEDQGLKPDDNSQEINKKYPNHNNQESENTNQKSGDDGITFCTLPAAKMLREWVDNHNLDAWDIRTVRYKLKYTFSGTITEAAGDYVAQGRLQHAMRIKTEFMSLLNLAQDFDKLCVQRVNEDDDALYFEHTRTRLKQAVYDLANLIDGCCPLPKQSEPSRLQQNRMHAEIQRTPPHRIVEIPAVEKQQPTPAILHSSQTKSMPIVEIPDTRISFAEAAEIVSVAKGTISKRADQKRFFDNGQNGHAPADITSQAADAHLPATLPTTDILPKEEWITVTEAADIMFACKGTVSKWAEQGLLQDNGQTRKKRRLLKSSVLMLKQKLEDIQARRERREEREDERRNNAKLQ